MTPRGYNFNYFCENQLTKSSAIHLIKANQNQNGCSVNKLMLIWLLIVASTSDQLRKSQKTGWEAYQYCYLRKQGSCRFSVAKFRLFQSWNGNFPDIIKTITLLHKCHKRY